MKNYRTKFDEIEWQATPEGARFKVCEIDGKQIRLLEFGRDLRHPDWCARGHTGCILTGEMRLEFENGADVIYRAGDLLHIPAGAADRHRPSASSELVRVIFWEETASNE